MSGPFSRFAPRLARVREAMREADLDAFVVTHAPNVQYLTGFRASAGLVLVTGTRWALVVDFRYAAAARAAVESAADPGARVIVPPRSYDETLVEQLLENGALRIGIEAAWMPVSRFTWLSSHLADASPTPLAGGARCPVLVPTERLVERGRAVKDRWEIDTLREGAHRLAAMTPEVLGLVREGRTEREVAADIDFLLRRRGFDRPAFETIVASGPNSARPHARPGSRVLRDGEGVVLDFGGVYDGYCVDLSRTVHLGAPGPAFRRIFDAVAEAQRAAIAAVRPGVQAGAVDAAAREVLERHGLGEAFGHGTGHGLGLEVHEEPRVGRPVPGLPDPVLEAGMVFTVEPGAYVEDTGGVRIEDDVVVTDTGCEVLTRPADRPGGRMVNGRW